MPIELTAHTEAGARLVAIAEKLSPQLAARAAEHDRDGSYPFEAIDALKAAGYFAAPVPIELGGLGVSSAHDLVVASSRLARGDASVAIGVNMHLVAVLNMERRRQVAVAAGQERRARGFASSLEQIARDGVVLAAAISERGQDLTRPGTLATRTESGWRIDGRKMFCTMSPAATDLYVAVTYADDDGIERYAYAMVPTDAPGVVVHDDWDALGMRASGSNSITLEGVELPESGVRGGFRAGDPLPYMERNLVAGLFHAAASLGIAESADAIARQGVAGHINGDARPRIQVAENTIDLAASRGVISRAAALIDHHRAANPASDGSAEQLGAAVRRGPGREGVHQRGGRPHRGPRARPLRRRRLRQRQPARPRVPRRQGRLVHAPARGQPRLRLPRPRRARRTDVAPLKCHSQHKPPLRRRPTRARSATRSADSRPASRSSRQRPTASPLGSS